MNTTASDPASSAAPGHSLAEDILAVFTGTLMVSFGVVMFKQAGLLTGSTAGLAFLIFYLTAVPFGAAFFVINLPFYYFAFKRMGWRFTLKSFFAVLLVSLFAETHRTFIRIGAIEPFYAAVFGGFLMGVGFIVLFRHQASLGGVNIMALYLQDKYGVRAGKVQMAVDIVILLGSYFVVSLPALVASVIGAIAINAVIWMNHRHDRYVGWSAP